MLRVHAPPCLPLSVIHAFPNSNVLGVAINSVSTLFVAMGLQGVTENSLFSHEQGRLGLNRYHAGTYGACIKAQKGLWGQERNQLGQLAVAESSAKMLELNPG